MKLGELLKDVGVTEMTGTLDMDISGVAYHTKDVLPGGLFVAIEGSVADGHKFIDIAIDKGASVIVSARRAEVPDDIANVIVQSPRRALAQISARFFGEPSKKFNLVGVTGTNGKTTITYLLEAIWSECGYPSGVVGTVNYRYPGVVASTGHTTPESYELQKIFSDMKKVGVTHVAMEVSSHSLDQERVYGCQFDGALFTNLTQDHLDYHLDMKRYGEAKSLLFTEHLKKSTKKNPWAAINADSAFGNQLAKDIKNKVFLYSISKKVDVFMENAEYSLRGSMLEIRIGDSLLKLKTRLIGKYNISNILAAATAAFASGTPLECVKKGIESVGFIPGRLEPVPNSKGLNVMVDYAHTPDAIKNVTTALKELNPKRLITVFGCGGDRDKTKRPLMGSEAALTSDVVIITSDNPRSEDPTKIIDEILHGIKKIGLVYEGEEGGYWVKIKRYDAIKKAIELAGPEDVVLIAGKGHENYQIIGAERLDFDDVEVAKQLIEELK